MGILTNPVYIGWWIPIDGGVIEDNHDPIVAEALFVYAHKQLSAYDLQGERQKPERATRNGRVKALLKKVIKAPNGDAIYAAHENGRLVYRYAAYTGLFHEYQFSASIQIIDKVFLQKFLERLAYDFQRDYHWKENAQEKQTVKKERESLIAKQIKLAEDKRASIMEMLTDKEAPLTKRMRDDYIQQCAGLESKIEQLKKDLEEFGSEAEQEEETLYEISTLIPEIVQEWDNVPYEKQQRFIRALVHKVTLDIVTPSWLKLEIEWKFPNWPTDIGHTRRQSSWGTWTDEEDAIMHELYPAAGAAAILKALPNRTWKAIIARSFKVLRIARTRRLNSLRAQDFLTLTWQDIEYAEENGLVVNNKNPQWCAWQLVRR